MNESLFHSRPFMEFVWADMDYYANSFNLAIHELSLSSDGFFCNLDCNTFWNQFIVTYCTLQFQKFLSLLFNDKNHQSMTRTKLPKTLAFTLLIVIKFNLAQLLKQIHTSNSQSDRTYSSKFASLCSRDQKYYIF